MQECILKQLQPVGTETQSTENRSQSSEGSSSEGDQVEYLKQMLLDKDYRANFLKEELAKKERALAEVEIQSCNLHDKLDKKSQNFKLSVELQK